MPVHAKYGGGTGEPNDPYLIYTAEQMNAIGAEPNDWSKHFKLMADIDLSAYGGSAFKMIGSYSTPFTGVFDGDNHTISDFKISRSSAPIGMFGCLNDPKAQIKNLGLINPAIQERLVSSVGSMIGSLRAGTISNCYVKGGRISSSSASYIGGLVGENRGTVSDCNSTANVSGEYGVSGLIGKNEGHITNCWSGGEISASYGVVGGIAGDNSGSVVECGTTGAVSGGRSGGGVVGFNRSEGTIRNCCSQAVVSGYIYIGGLVGLNKGTIVTCYSVGRVNGTTDVGGLVGLNDSGASITNCYSHGSVSGQGQVGGLLGTTKGRIVSCYSAGAVTGTASTGGLVGLNDSGQVQNSFWDVQTSGQTASAGGWGKATAEMQTANTFAGWGRDPIWTIDEGNHYPRFAWEATPGQTILTLYGGGSGTESDPYLIYAPEQLDAMSVDPDNWDKHFRLMADLDLHGVVLYPIGDFSGDFDTSRPFSGVFDGNGKTISNFRSNTGGIFKYVSGYVPGLEYLVTGVEVRNLTLIDPSVQGGSWPSPLVNVLNYATVKRCSVTNGQVSEGSFAGGLMGLVRKSTVEECSVIGGNVSGTSYVGGLVGIARDSVVKNCFSSASADGSDHVGGLVGGSLEASIITSCGATGDIHGRDDYVGGLAGSVGRQSTDSDCTVAGSFASGDVSGRGSIGGLVGHLRYSQIMCSYATGQVSGVNEVGGLVGSLFVLRVIDSYATGRVEGTGDDVGGFLGDDYPPMYDCFWDTETSGMSSGGLAGGLTTAQMHDPNTFISAGWDFVGETDNGPSDIWIMPDGGGYPILSWQASPLPPLPTFSGGTGAPNDPLLISTPQELNSIHHNPRLMAAHFKLADDVNLAGDKFFPIGHEGYPFTGVFDGGGHRIHNFSYEASIKYPENTGLFRYVRGISAEIRGLTLTRSYVVNEVDVGGDDSDNVGSLVGLLYDGAIVNCHVEDGEILAEELSYVGGLIGHNWHGIIEGCSSSVTVTGSHIEDFGGVVGCNRYVVIDSHSLGSVLDGYFHVGGLAGSNWALIKDSSAYANVLGWKTVGGLVGWNLGTIRESCSYSDVSGTESTGGLVGENLGDISNGYARGPVTGYENVGGLVGNHTHREEISGRIEASYSTGYVSGKKNVGGFVYRGHKAATTSDDCYWDIQTSGQVASDGGTGKTTAEMQTASTFLDAGWDFVDETPNGTEDIWWIDEGKDYPRLWWEQGDEEAP